MNIAALRAALATDIDAIDDLDCVGYTPVDIVPPTAFVDAPVIQFDDTFGGDFTVTFPVVVLTSKADSESGQAALDTLLPQIRTAVSHTLGGTAQSAHVLRVEGYGADTYQFAGLAYIGATFIVEVYAA